MMTEHSFAPMRTKNTDKVIMWDKNAVNRGNNAPHPLIMSCENAISLSGAGESTGSLFRPFGYFPA